MIALDFKPTTKAELAQCLADPMWTSVTEGHIYYIASSETGRVYVGSTTRRLRQRWLEHLHYLRKGTHHSPHLQRVYKKYGEDDLSLILAQEVVGESLLAVEQRHIDSFTGWCLNAAPVSVSIYAAHAANRARVMPDDEKARRSASAKLSILEGRAKRGPWSDERKARHSIRLTGRTMPPMTDETKKNIGEGRRLSNALRGASAKPKRDRYAYIAAELPTWVEMAANGMSYREIERVTGRCRSMITRECKRAAS